MLTPAVNAYGWTFVSVLLVVAGLTLLVLALDFRRYCRDVDARRDARKAAERAELAAAVRRHPAGRHRPRPGVGLHGRIVP